MKYQPYQGYHYARPWLSYGEGSYPKRVRTRSDWQYGYFPHGHAIWHEYRVVWHPGGKREVRATPPAFCRRCGKVHCHDCGCYQPWKRWGTNRHGSVYEKTRVHRIFRRQANDAIRRELAGDDAVSHHFIVSGDYLD